MPLEEPLDMPAGGIDVRAGEKIEILWQKPPEAWLKQSILQQENEGAVTHLANRSPHRLHHGVHCRLLYSPPVGSPTP